MQTENKNLRPIRLVTDFQMVNKIRLKQHDQYKFQEDHLSEWCNRNYVSLGEEARLDRDAYTYKMDGKPVDYDYMNVFLPYWDGSNDRLQSKPFFDEFILESYPDFEKLKDKTKGMIPNFAYFKYTDTGLMKCIYPSDCVSVTKKYILKQFDDEFIVTSFDIETGKTGTDVATYKNLISAQLVLHNDEDYLCCVKKFGQETDLEVHKIISPYTKPEYVFGCELEEHMKFNGGYKVGNKQVRILVKTDHSKNYALIFG